MPLTGTRTVVLVENKKHRLISDLLTRQLQTVSCRTLPAESVEDCEELIEKRDPDLVMIDASLADGIEMIDRIRSRHPGLAVLALVHSNKMAALMKQKGIARVDGRDGIDAMLRVIEQVTGAGLADSSQKQSVLIVDDDPEVRSMLADFLRSRDYSVFTAGNSRQALEVLDRNPSIPVVLLDVMMPDAGGLQTLAAISKRRPHPTVIMISALADGVIARHAIDQGAFDYMLKPLDLATVESSVSAASSDYAYRN